MNSASLSVLPLFIYMLLYVVIVIVIYLNSLDYYFYIFFCVLKEMSIN